MLKTTASRSKNCSVFLHALVAVACVSALSNSAFAQDGALANTPNYDNQSQLTKDMGITQKLGVQLPMDTPFKDDEGKSIKFGDIFSGRPMVMIPMFYACRTGCSVITDSLLKTLTKATAKTNIAEFKADDLRVGRDLDVIFLSIDPVETPELAHGKKVLVMDAYHQPGTENGWHMLTGSMESIHKITDAIGFKYKYDAPRHLINHPVCSVLITPKGVVSGYTIGAEVQTRVLESALALARNDKVGESADQSFMFGCIMVDPTTGKRRVIIENVLRLAGVVTLIVLVTSIVGMSIKSRRETSLPGGQPGA